MGECFDILLLCMFCFLFLLRIGNGKMLFTPLFINLRNVKQRKDCIVLVLLQGTLG